MNKTLSITITNIPQGMYDYLWRNAKLLAQKEMGGFKPQEIENINIDCQTLDNKQAVALNSLLSAMITGLVLYQHDI